MPGVNKDVEELKISYTSGGNVKQQHHFGKQFGSFSEVKHSYMI